MEFQHTAFGETFNCIAEMKKYTDGTPALVIIDAEDGSPVATASINPESKVETPENHIWLKTWSENVGLDDSLEEACIIELTERIALINQHGDYAVLAKLTPKFLATLNPVS